jgi:hypothetical protein
MKCWGGFCIRPFGIIKIKNVLEAHSKNLELVQRRAQSEY